MYWFPPQADIYQNKYFAGPLQCETWRPFFNRGENKLLEVTYENMKFIEWYRNYYSMLRNNQQVKPSSPPTLEHAQGTVTVVLQMTGSRNQSNRDVRPTGFKIFHKMNGDSRQNYLSHSALHAFCRAAIHHVVYITSATSLLSPGQNSNKLNWIDWIVN